MTWHQEVESLLTSLTGVISARVVGRAGVGVEEVHLLTTVEVAPKQTVRNVESALLARFDLPVDHRKISVAQTTASQKPRHIDAPSPESTAPVPAWRAVGHTKPQPRQPRRPRPEPAQPEPQRREAPRPAPPRPAEVASRLAPVIDPPAPERSAPTIVRALEPAPVEERVLFVGHSIESLRSQRLRMKVALEWRGHRLVGETSGADLARSRMEGFATATLRAVESALDSDAPGREPEDFVLTLDGVQVVEAFDRQFVLVAVNALLGRDFTLLTGAAAVDDSRDRAVILATLQAIDRRVRAFLQGIEALPASATPTSDSGTGDPFEVWA